MQLVTMLLCLLAIMPVIMAAALGSGEPLAAAGNLSPRQLTNRRSPWIGSVLTVTKTVTKTQTKTATPVQMTTVTQVQTTTATVTEPADCEATPTPDPSPSPTPAPSSPTTSAPPTAPTFGDLPHQVYIVTFNGDYDTPEGKANRDSFFAKINALGFPYIVTYEYTLLINAVAIDMPTQYYAYVRSLPEVHSISADSGIQM